MVTSLYASYDSYTNGWVGLLYSNLGQTANVPHISQIRARVKKLKLQLRTPKRDKSVSVYLLDIKKTVDTLATVDSPITTEGHIDAILDSLPNEYHSFVTTITSRLDPYTVADVESLLLATRRQVFQSKVSLISLFCIYSIQTYMVYIGKKVCLFKYQRQIKSPNK